MSSPIELFGSYLGTAAGIVYQFSVTLSRLANDENAFVKVSATVIVLYLSVKLLRRTWGLLVLVFKSSIVSFIAALVLRTYEIGFHESAKHFETYVANAYGQSVTVFQTIKNLIEAFDSHLVDNATNAWYNLKNQHNL